MPDYLSDYSHHTEGRPAHEGRFGRRHVKGPTRAVKDDSKKTELATLPTWAPEDRVLVCGGCLLEIVEVFPRITRDAPEICVVAPLRDNKRVRGSLPSTCRLEVYQPDGYQRFTESEVVAILGGLGLEPLVIEAPDFEQML